MLKYKVRRKLVLQVSGMKKNYIALSSITYAIKAKKILNLQGIRCEIERTPKNLGKGCGYSISFLVPPEEIFPRLRAAGISWKAHGTAE